MSETVQPAPETDEKRSRGLGSCVLWAFAAVMIYVLSSGPSYRICRGSHPHPAFMHIYRPIDWVYRETFLRRPIGMYLHFWRSDLLGLNGEICVTGSGTWSLEYY
jgi:hypothetical protein